MDDDRPPAAIDVIRHLEGAVPDAGSAHRVYLHGTKVEVIGTGAVTESDLDGLDDRQILFVAGHRRALETATPLTLVGDDGVRATVPVARAGALVAMKLHAIQDRRAAGGNDKRAGDAWDIYRLLTDLDLAATAAELRSGSESLRRAVTAAAHRILVDRVGRTLGWLRQGDIEMASVSLDDLLGAGTELLRHLEPGA